MINSELNFTHSAKDHTQLTSLTHHSSPNCLLPNQYRNSRFSKHQTKSKVTGTMKFTILATALALCGLSTAYEVKQGGFKVAITDQSGTTKTWEVPIFNITRFEGDTPSEIGRQVFGSDNTYSGNVKVELVSGPQPAYCTLQHWTGFSVSWVVQKGAPFTDSEPFTGQVRDFGGIACYEGVPSTASTGAASSGQVASASSSRVSRLAGSWFS